MIFKSVTAVEEPQSIRDRRVSYGPAVACPEAIRKQTTAKAKITPRRIWCQLKMTYVYRPRKLTLIGQINFCGSASYLEFSLSDDVMPRSSPRGRRRKPITRRRRPRPSSDFPNGGSA